jgi:hypothetical protein
MFVAQYIWDLWGLWSLLAVVAILLILSALKAGRRHPRIPRHLSVLEMEEQLSRLYSNNEISTDEYEQGLWALPDRPPAPPFSRSTRGRKHVNE